MAYPSPLVILKAIGVGSRQFIRNRQQDRAASYVNVYTLDSLDVVRDTLDIRSSETGDSNQPSSVQRRHNVNRTYACKGLDQKVYKATVNLTVVIPGGAVIDSSMVDELLSDVLSVATNLSVIGDPGGPTENISNDIDAMFLQAIQILDS
jgi:hypothetical protein